MVHLGTVSKATTVRRYGKGERGGQDLREWGLWCYRMGRKR